MKKLVGVLLILVVSVFGFSCKKSSKDTPDIKPPVFSTFDAPAAAQVYSAPGGKILLKTTATDDRALKSLVVKIAYKPTTPIAVIKSTTGLDDAWTQDDITITLSGASQVIDNQQIFGDLAGTFKSGTYTITLILTDQADLATTKTVDVQLIF